jgi:hypothetical protein
VTLSASVLTFLLACNSLITNSALLRNGFKHSELLHQERPFATTSGKSVSKLLTGNSLLYTVFFMLRVTVRRPIFRICFFMDPQRTLLPTFPLLLHAYLLLWERGVDRIKNSGLNVVTVLFLSSSFLCWLHNPVFQRICHNIIDIYAHNKELMKLKFCIHRHSWKGCIPQFIMYFLKLLSDFIEVS